MPRGTRDGSIFREEATLDLETGLERKPARFIVRRRYTDLKGRRREKTRYAATEKAAERVLSALKAEIKKELAGTTHSTPRGMTFKALVKYCKEHQLRPAVYAGETKIAGLRTWQNTWSALKPVEKFLGPMDITQITNDDLEDYKLHRLAEPILYSKEEPVLVDGEPLVIDGKLQKEKVLHSRQRAIASVQRELAWARRVLSIALKKKWITEQPFTQGDPIIKPALENKRGRIISPAEERALFAACTGKRKHLAFAMTMALETGMRQNEQFRIDIASDIDLEGRLLTALSYKGKRVQRRPVPITEHLFPLLVAKINSRTSGKLFTSQDARTAFVNACAKAGIENLTWHDLRHTAITRMVHLYNIPPHDVMKISGHSNWKTFWETYVNIDNDMVRSIGDRINAARAAMLPATVAPVEVSDAVN